jgi:hypothetical protein
VTYTWLTLPDARNVGVAPEAPVAVIKPMTSEMLVNVANARALRRAVDRVDIPYCPPWTSRPRLKRARSARAE